MLPVLYRFTFSTLPEQLLLYALAIGLVAYLVISAYRNTMVVDASGKEVPAPAADRLNRAILYFVGGTGLAGFGLYYALPSVGGLIHGKGEGIPIHTYGVLVGSGFLCAVTVAGWLCAREWPGELGLKRREQMMDMAFYLFVGAMIGSRVLFIIVNWKDYAAQPSKIFDLGGGLVFYGGLIGASLTAYWYAKKHDIEFLRLADLAIPTVSLGQALGRLGCFSAGCCWGDITTHDKTRFAVEFPGTNVTTLFGGLSNTPSLAFSSQRDDARWVLEATGQVFHEPVAGAVRISDWAAQHGHTLPVHPTQLYESVGQMGLFVMLLFLRRYRRFHGQIFGLWLMCYAVLRSSVELFRGDVERGTLNGLLNYLGASGLAQKVPLEAWYNISTSQFISICLFSLGAWTIARKSQELAARPPVDLTALTA